MDEELKRCLNLGVAAKKKYRPIVVVLIIGIVVSALYFLFTYESIENWGAAEKENIPRKVSWITAIGVYFGVVVNLLLFLFTILTFYFAKVDVTNTDNSKYGNAWVVGIIFTVSCLVLMSSIFYKYKVVEKEEIHWSLLFGISGAIVISGFLLGLLFHYVIKHRRVLSDKDIQCYQKAEKTLTDAASKVQSNLLREYDNANRKKKEAEQILKNSQNIIERTQQDLEELKNLGTSPDSVIDAYVKSSRGETSKKIPSNYSRLIDNQQNSPTQNTPEESDDHRDAFGDFLHNLKTAHEQSRSRSSGVPSSSSRSSSSRSSL